MPAHSGAGCGWKERPGDAGALEIAPLDRDERKKILVKGILPAVERLSAACLLAIAVSQSVLRRGKRSAGNC